MPDTLTLPEWTSDPPTEPGLYRFRRESDGKVLWLLVMGQAGGIGGMAYLFGSAWGKEVVKLRGEWQGPLVVEGEE